MKKLLFVILLCLPFGTIEAQESTIKEDSKRTNPATYQGELGVGFGYGFGDANSVLIETVHGLRFNPYLFTGLGVGINYYDGFGLLTPALNMKGYYPVTRIIDLYLSWDIGAAVGIAEWGGDSDLYASIGPGINFGNRKGSPRGDFSIRVQRMGENSGTLIFRLGIVF